MALRIVEVTNPDSGAIVEPNFLSRAEHVHRQLRPQLPTGADYEDKMKRVIAGGGRMLVACAVGDDSNKILGICVFRVIENTAEGRKMYCDDLVSDADHRSRGVGTALISHMRTLAQTRNCNYLALDSGTQRQQAHKFYFREGFVISAFHFSSAVKLE